jgi:hypothetical protein
MKSTHEQGALKTMVIRNDWLLPMNFIGLNPCEHASSLDDRFHETAQLRFGLRSRKIRLFRRPHVIRTLEALD